MERRGEVVKMGGFYTLVLVEPAPLPHIYISEEVEGKIWRKRKLRPADVYACLRDPKAKAREIPPRLSRELVAEVLQEQPDWTPSPLVLWVGRGSGGRILSLVILDEDPPILVTALLATKAHIGLVQYEG
jgi:hypothetical protein